MKCLHLCFLDRSSSLNLIYASLYSQNHGSPSPQQIFFHQSHPGSTNWAGHVRGKPLVKTIWMKHVLTKRNHLDVPKISKAGQSSNLSGIQSSSITWIQPLRIEIEQIQNPCSQGGPLLENNLLGMCPTCRSSKIIKTLKKAPITRSKQSNTTVFEKKKNYNLSLFLKYIGIYH